MPDDLLTRLREAANGPALTPDRLFFRPESVQRGLERQGEQFRTELLAEGLTGAQARLIWAAVLDAFLSGVSDHA